MLVWPLLDSQALAHHVMDGDVPATSLVGFISGLGHPIVDLEHLAFIIGVGFVAWLHKRTYSLPLLFLIGMIVGVFVQFNFRELYSIEVAIAISVMVMGTLVVWPRTLNTRTVLLAIGVAGVLHGYSYGASILGAGPFPIAGYLIGLLLVQFGVMMLVVNLVDRLKTQAQARILLRTGGTGVLLVGLAFVTKSLI
jgi:urease accessory protein